MKMSDRMRGAAGAVYVQSNEPDNQVISYRRGEDGTLARAGSWVTGGKGSNTPHLTSQGSVCLSGDGRYLLVTNAASDDVSLFDLTGDEPRLNQRIGAGPAPKSVTEHGGLVYVLATGGPAVTAFRLSDGALAPISGSTRRLVAGADPAQVGFSADGATLVVTQRGTDSIVAFRVRGDGTLGDPETIASAGPTPYGFAFSSTGTLVVTEAFGAQRGKAAASSYALRNGAVTPVTGSVGNGRSEICWAVIKDDRYVFTTNFADGAVSRYAIGADGSLTLEDATAGIAVDGRTGLRDEDLTADGGFLYAIDADTRSIVGWSVAADGTLAKIGSWNGVPSTVAGLAAA
jgi:6-phosphogluconolactonase (cycloisomerase 2 family)